MDNLPLDGYRTRPRDGDPIDEGQELLEGLKEGPMGEKTDALVDVDVVAGRSILGVGRLQLQGLPLLLAEFLLGIVLIEGHGRSVHLVRGVGSVKESVLVGSWGKVNKFKRGIQGKM